MSIFMDFVFVFLGSLFGLLIGLLLVKFINWIKKEAIEAWNRRANDGHA